MKEASGELNTTVVIVVAVGILMAFFYYTLWPIIRDNFRNTNGCSDAICSCKNPGSDCDNGMIVCYPKNNKSTRIECIYKG